MRSCLLLSFSLVSGCVLLLLSASSAQSQCSANTIGFGDVGVVANNPFHAEVTRTTTGHTDMNATLRPNFPEWVARDSQGRVRTERVAGEFKRDTGPDAGSKVELHLIMICDPVAQTLTQIDTATLTAKIIHSRPSAPRSGVLQQGTRRAFCSFRLSSARNAARFQAEDLGDQIIEGLAAHGERVTMPMLGATTPEESPKGESTSERWCADSLSALVLTIAGNTKTGVKTTIAMRNIDRTEPDPALFQIPPDYTVTESVAEPRQRRDTNVAPNEQPAQQP
jgi:hypothetical protein